MNTLQRIWELVTIASKHLQENGISTKENSNLQAELYKIRNSELSLVALNKFLILFTEIYPG